MSKVKVKNHQTRTINQLLLAESNSNVSTTAEVIKAKNFIESIENIAQAEIIDENKLEDKQSNELLALSLENIVNDFENSINTPPQNLSHAEAGYLLVKKLLQDPEFLPTLSEHISNSLIMKMDKNEQFGYIKRYGQNDKLTKIKQALDKFTDDLIKSINNEVYAVANNTFTKVKNG